jgi:uncharacterized protein YdhG (YjbR/CyaY superfamily)
MSAKKTTQKPARVTTEEWTDEERAAMKARAKELKAAAAGAKANGESAVLEAIAAMPGPDRAIGERLHTIIKTSAPSLSPKTWYGMPAYARDGKVVCFFRGAEKFKERYMTFGFNDVATLDDGNLWPIAFALTELTPAEEKRISELVKRAVG